MIITVVAAIILAAPFLVDDEGDDSATDVPTSDVPPPAKRTRVS
jgi:hypothetical protein